MVKWSAGVDRMSTLTEDYSSTGDGSGLVVISSTETRELCVRSSNPRIRYHPTRNTRTDLRGVSYFNKVGDLKRRTDFV